MTPNETELLTLIEAEWDRVAALSGVRNFSLGETEWISHATARGDMKAGRGIRINGRWLGTSEADRQARRRALLSLEQRGVVELYAAYGRKITHVLLVGGKLPLPPPTPPPQPQIEHRPTMVEQRRAAAEAWSQECKAKATTGSEPQQ